jgi:hypothetical protein
MLTLSHQWHEDDGDALFPPCISVWKLLDPEESLNLVLGSYGNDEKSPGLELLDQKAWHKGPAGGHDDRVKECMLLPTDIAVPSFGRHVVVA